MGLKDQILADTTAVFLSQDEFAEVIQYNEANIVAIPEIGASNIKGNTISSEGSADRAQFWIAVSDVQQPAAGDIIVHKGKRWEVLRVIESDLAMQQVECIANESAFPLR
ncbi:MAG: hypothetical protein N2491_01715 [Negativicutes bacterium]|nr:hypothetical protein [Negativicutes bacterium]